jgi:hypothetical protein
MNEKSHGGKLAKYWRCPQRGGRRRVRLILASVPFGYRSPEHEEADLAAFRELLVG